MFRVNNNKNNNVRWFDAVDFIRRVCICTTIQSGTHFTRPPFVAKANLFM